MHNNMIIYLVTYNVSHYSFIFVLNYTAPSEIYTLSLHDALPIYANGNKGVVLGPQLGNGAIVVAFAITQPIPLDRKSTRLNSSHVAISYAVFCLKKKNVFKLYSSNR